MYERSGKIIRQKFREYLVPTVLTSMAVSMASVVDGMIVGLLLGDVALAAIGLSSPVVFSINLIYMLFAIGGSTCASIAQGKRDFRLTDRIFTLTIGGGLAVMCLFLLVMQLILHPLSVSLSGGDLQAAGLMERYLRPLLFTGPALMLSSGMAMFIRMDGNPGISAMIIMVANGVNLVFDYLLIRFANAGIFGAGISTTLGYLAGCGIVLHQLRKKEHSFHFTAPGKDTLMILADIIKTGMPKAINQVCHILRSLIINALMIRAYGSIGVSIMTVCTNVLMITNIFVGGVSDSLLPIVGTLYGERDYFGMRHAMKTAGRVLFLCCSGLFLIFLLFPGFFGSLFGIRTEEAMELLTPALRMYALYVPFFAFLLLHQNFYNTTRRRNLAAVLVVLDGLLFVVLFAVLFSAIDANLIWLCFAASGCSTGIALLLLADGIRKKESVKGLLLIQEQNEEKFKFDFSLEATPEEAARLSGKVLDLKEKGFSDERLLGKIAVALEEMILACIHYAHQDRKGMIDILVRVTEEQITIQMRDNGKGFNPLEFLPEENDGCVTDGITLVKKLATCMEYSRQLGFNTCILIF